VKFAAAAAAAATTAAAAVEQCADLPLCLPVHRAYIAATGWLLAASRAAKLVVWHVQMIV
jgi:hypothetical protein